MDDWKNNTGLIHWASIDYVTPLVDQILMQLNNIWCGVTETVVTLYLDPQSLSGLKQRRCVKEGALYPWALAR